MPFENTFEDEERRVINEFDILFRSRNENVIQIKNGMKKYSNNSIRIYSIIENPTQRVNRRKTTYYEK